MALSEGQVLRERLVVLVVENVGVLAGEAVAFAAELEDFVLRGKPSPEGRP